MLKRLLRLIMLGTAMLLVWDGSGKAEGLPDILGIQLGMPAREAHAKLQSQLPKNKIQVQSTNLPTIDKPVINSFVSAPVQQIMMGMEGDQVRVDVTLPPNKQSVWRVRRERFFADKGILKTTLLASLREKYGKESRAMTQTGKATTDEKQIESLLWLMDEQGHQSPLPALSGSGVDPLWTCKSFVEDGNSALIVESPPPTTFASSDYKWCLASYTAVVAHLLQSPSALELSERLLVSIINLPMGSRAGEVTKKWKEDIAAGQHRQDIEKAKQQEKPKL